MFFSRSFVLLLFSVVWFGFSSSTCVECFFPGLLFFFFFSWFGLGFPVQHGLSVFFPVFCSSSFFRGLVWVFQFNMGGVFCWLVWVWHRIFVWGFCTIRHMLIGSFDPPPPPSRNPRDQRIFVRGYLQNWLNEWLSVETRTNTTTQTQKAFTAHFIIHYQLLNISFYQPTPNKCQPPSFQYSWNRTDRLNMISGFKTALKGSLPRKKKPKDRPHLSSR